MCRMGDEKLQRRSMSGEQARVSEFVGVSVRVRCQSEQRGEGREEREYDRGGDRNTASYLPMNELPLVAFFCLFSASGFAQ